MPGARSSVGVLLRLANCKRRRRVEIARPRGPGERAETHRTPRRTAHLPAPLVSAPVPVPVPVQVPVPVGTGRCSLPRSARPRAALSALALSLRLRETSSGSASVVSLASRFGAVSAPHCLTPVQLTRNTESNHTHDITHLKPHKRNDRKRKRSNRRAILALRTLWIDPDARHALSPTSDYTRDSAAKKYSRQAGLCVHL